MELANPFFPMRAVIRCKAKQQLLQDPSCEDLCFVLDLALFKDLTATLLQSPDYIQRFSQCQTKQAAIAVENQMAAEIATTYQRIKRSQDSSHIQQLNGLLEL